MRKYLFVLLLLFAFILTGCPLESNSTTEDENTTTDSTTVEPDITLTEDNTTTTEEENTTIDENVPTVTNKDELIVDFYDYSVTKGDLYGMMVKNRGAVSFVNYLDRQLISEEDYEDYIDYEGLEKEINGLKSHGESGFYENLIAQGIINSIDDENKEVKIKDFYILPYLQKGYAKKQAVEDLGEDTITDEITSFTEEPPMCVITLKYDTPTERIEAKYRLDQTEDVQQFFIDEFLDQNDGQYNENDPITTDDFPFLASDFNCDYDLVNYNDNIHENLRNLIYEDEVGTYTEASQLIGYYYYLVYRLDTPEFIDDYENSNELRDYIVEQLIDDVINEGYIADKITELHRSINLKIYDTTLGQDYIDLYDENFTVENNLLDNTTIASYTDPQTGDLIKISADDFYNNMKTRYGIGLLLDQINYIALSKVPEIALTDKEEQDVKTQKNKLKQGFLQQQTDLTWNEYLEQYGIFSEEQLINFLAGQTLKNKYILEEDETTAQDKADAYDRWFEATARHVLFKYDPNDQDSIDEARANADQIINGCLDYNFNTEEYEYRNGITEDSCIVFYDPGDPNASDQPPFKGLDETSIAHLTSTFEYFTTLFSQDDDDYTIGENLGAFGPYKMVEEFENAVKDVINNIENDGVKYSTEPIDDDEFNGFHVIYVQSYDIEKPEKPENYDEIKVAIANEDTSEYTDEEVNAVKAYDNFINDTIVPLLEDQRITIDNINYYLAELRNENNFSFKDSELQTIYESIQSMYIEN